MKHTCAKPFDAQKAEMGLRYCACGREGFVDLGDGQSNRYPCLECYLSLRRKPERAIDRR